VSPTYFFPREGGGKGKGKWKEEEKGRKLSHERGGGGEVTSRVFAGRIGRSYKGKKKKKKKKRRRRTSLFEKEKKKGGKKKRKTSSHYRGGKKQSKERSHPLPGKKGEKGGLCLGEKEAIIEWRNKRKGEEKEAILTTP